PPNIDQSLEDSRQSSPQPADSGGTVAPDLELDLQYCARGRKRISRPCSVGSSFLSTAATVGATMARRCARLVWGHQRLKSGTRDGFFSAASGASRVRRDCLSTLSR